MSTVVLVTGGTRGVGAGIAQGFADAGAEVVVCGRTPPGPSGESPATTISGSTIPGSTIPTFLAADVRNAEQVAAMIDTIVERFGRLDVVVNNAGGSPPADAAAASPRFSEAIVRLNLLAPLLVAGLANAVMQRQSGGGSIINIASLGGLRPSPGTAIYSAAKAGLIDATVGLSMEYAPKVRVNCVTPGAIATQELYDQYGGDDYFDAVAATVPMGRMGRPHDVASACVFLASEAAAFITGANLLVHGGGDAPPAVATTGRVASSAS